MGAPDGPVVAPCALQRPLPKLRCGEGGGPHAPLLRAGPPSLNSAAARQAEEVVGPGWWAGSRTFTLLDEVPSELATACCSCAGCHDVGPTTRPSLRSLPTTEPDALVSACRRLRLRCRTAQRAVSVTRFTRRSVDVLVQESFKKKKFLDLVTEPVDGSDAGSAMTPETARGAVRSGDEVVVQA